MASRFFAGTDQKENSALRLLLNKHLNTHYNTDKPLKITLIGAMADGLGDFIHLFDVYKFYNARYAQKPMRFQFISMVNEEYNKLKKIYKDQFPASHYVVKESTFDEEKLKQSQFLIICSTNMLIYEKLMAAIKDQEGIINVSFSLSGSVASLIMKAKPPNAHIESVVEYGYKSEEDLYEAKKDGLAFVYNESYMGINKTAKGIKINRTINELSHIKSKSSILNSLENKNLLDRLSGGNSQDYLTTHSVACGYMQSERDTENFVLTAAAITKKSHVDIFVNKNLLSEDKLLSQLKRLGVTSVEIINNDGDTQRAISQEKGNSKHTEKTVRLIGFSGTSEADKEKWISISDCVAASGDTSLTEMISSRKFPVFATGYKSGMIQEGFISELEERNPRPEELISYLKLTLTGKEIDFAIQFAKHNYKRILTQWEVFCDEIISKHDVSAHLVTVMDNTLIASIFRKGEEEEIKKLLDLIPGWRIGDTNFVVLALLTENKKALEFMTKTDPEKFNILANEKHPSLDLSAIDVVGLFANPVPDIAQQLLALTKKPPNLCS
jgi:hypothetical protein